MEHTLITETPPVTVSIEEGAVLKRCEDFCLENGSSQGQNLDRTVLCVPNSLDGGEWGFGRLAEARCECRVLGVECLAWDVGCRV